MELRNTLKDYPKEGILVICDYYSCIDRGTRARCYLDDFIYCKRRAGVPKQASNIKKYQK